MKAPCRRFIIIIPTTTTTTAAAVLMGMNGDGHAHDNLCGDTGSSGKKQCKEEDNYFGDTTFVVGGVAVGLHGSLMICSIPDVFII